jgi:uncharacterized protein YjiS (DUF1127 family)
MPKTNSTMGNAPQTEVQGALVDPAAAARVLNAIWAELRTAADAENEHRNLDRRSDAQLKQMGLSRCDLPEHIRRRYY